MVAVENRELRNGLSAKHGEIKFKQATEPAGTLLQTQLFQKMKIVLERRIKLVIHHHPKQHAI